MRYVFFGRQANYVVDECKWMLYTPLS